jgi:hypothetical protein
VSCVLANNVDYGLAHFFLRNSSLIHHLNIWFEASLDILVKKLLCFFRFCLISSIFLESFIQNGGEEVSLEISERKSRQFKVLDDIRHPKVSSKLDLKNSVEKLFHLASQEPLVTF